MYEKKSEYVQPEMECAHHSEKKNYVAFARIYRVASEQKASNSHVGDCLVITVSFFLVCAHKKNLTVKRDIKTIFLFKLVAETDYECLKDGNALQHDLGDDDLGDGIV